MYFYEPNPHRTCDGPENTRVDRFWEGGGKSGDVKGKSEQVVYGGLVGEGD